MRLRLGLLQDAKSIEKQIAREAAEAQAKKHKLEVPTVKTEAQARADEAAAARAKEKGTDKPKALFIPKQRIRPLSESKAIDSGATFVSETFLFLVGMSLILLENWRSRRKETSRREDVADRISELEDGLKNDRRALVELEKEILRLRAKNGKGATPGKRIIPEELWEPGQEKLEEAVKPRGLFSWFRGQSQEKASGTADSVELSLSTSNPVISITTSGKDRPKANRSDNPGSNAAISSPASRKDTSKTNGSSEPTPSSRKEPPPPQTSDPS